MKGPGVFFSNRITGQLQQGLMTDQKTVVIVGAGIGGLTAALFLARRGYHVKVYEKNAMPGGRCGQIIRDCHRFDLGATIFLMPGIYRDVLGSLGITLEEGTDLLRLGEIYTLCFDDGSSLAFTTDTGRMKAQMEMIEPGSFEKSREYITRGYEMFQVSLEKLLSRNFYHLLQFINPGNLGLLAKLKIHKNNWSYARQFFRHPHLLMAYTFQNIYVGQNPFTSPALFSMVPAAELTEGAFALRGGMYTIVERLLSAAEASGVELFCNRPVRKIIVSNNRAEGIMMEDGSVIGADIVLSNADLPYAYRELLPDRRKAGKINRMKYSCSALCFHWGLDKTYPRLGTHTVFLSDRFREGLDRIFTDKTIGDKPCFYVHAPARTDPTAAPQDQDTLSVIVGAGHVDRTMNQDWPMITKRTRSAVLDRLRQHGLYDIEEHIKFEICHTPADWERTCNVTRGSVFGSLGHTIFQMGYFRPHNRHNKYHNLYFVGGSTHPGNGIPNVLISARLVTERIISGK